MFTCMLSIEVSPHNRKDTCQKCKMENGRHMVLRPLCREQEGAIERRSMLTWFPLRAQEPLGWVEVTPCSEEGRPCLARSHVPCQNRCRSGEVLSLKEQCPHNIWAQQAQGRVSLSPHLTLLKGPLLATDSCRPGFQDPG